MDVTSRKDLIASAPSAEWKDKLWVMDEWRNVLVKRVPVSALVLNIDNRRFAAERQLFEAQLGRSLDPEGNEVDALSVEAILLDQNLEVEEDRVVGKPGKDYEALLKDWQRRKQESPFWIHADGTVRNGNRRLAMLRRLQRDEGAEGYQHIEAIVLDDLNLHELAIFEMEQREQLTEDFKIRYTDINLLLAIKDAATDKGIDWYDPASIKEVAGSLQHVMRNNQRYAIVQLYAIKYMDAYLRDLGMEGRYDTLIRQIERFRDVGNVMRALEDGDEAWAPSMLNVLFAAINAGLPHSDIRNVRKLFNTDREEFTRLVEQIGEVEQQWNQPSDEDALGSPEVVHDEVDDSDTSDERVDPPGPTVTNYPKDAVESVFKDTFDRYNAAQKAQKADVLSIVKEVNHRLDALINEDHDRLGPALDAAETTELRVAVNAMASWFEQYGSALR